MSFEFPQVINSILSWFESDDAGDPPPPGNSESHQEETCFSRDIPPSAFDAGVSPSGSRLFGESPLQCRRTSQRRESDPSLFVWLTVPLAALAAVLFRNDGNAAAPHDEEGGRGGGSDNAEDTTDRVHRREFVPSAEFLARYGGIRRDNGWYILDIPDELRSDLEPYHRDMEVRSIQDGVVTIEDSDRLAYERSGGPRFASLAHQFLTIQEATALGFVTRSPEGEILPSQNPIRLYSIPEGTETGHPFHSPSPADMPSGSAITSTYTLRDLMGEYDAQLTEEMLERHYDDGSSDAFSHVEFENTWSREWRHMNDYPEIRVLPFIRVLLSVESEDRPLSPEGQAYFRGVIEPILSEGLPLVGNTPEGAEIFARRVDEIMSRIRAIPDPETRDALTTLHILDCLNMEHPEQARRIFVGYDFSIVTYSDLVLSTFEELNIPPYQDAALEPEFEPRAELIERVRFQLGSELWDSAPEVADAIRESWRDLTLEERQELVDHSSSREPTGSIPEIVIRSHVDAMRDRNRGESLAEVRARAVERLRDPESRSLLERSLREARDSTRRGRR